MTLDRVRISRRLQRLERGAGPRRRRGGRRPIDPRKEAEQVTEAIERAVQRRARRAERLPKPAYPEDLPVSSRREEIAEAIRDHQVVVVCGETGSGKTTQLPKICLDAALGLGRGVEGVIGHTQPRRIAARTVAARIAEELNTDPGDLVGHKVRFTDETGELTLVKLMTDGVLLAETQGDPLLQQYDTIIVDEAHERSLNIDFLLGYLTTILPKRPDLKIVITSATIDPQRFADHFEKALHTKVPVILVEGRTYPVETRYRPLYLTDTGESEVESGPRDERDIISGVIDVMEEIDRERSAHQGGDVLIFMPGEREIRETANALADRYHASHHRGAGIEILPLYARLGVDEQRKVFRPLKGGRRIVIATNVAETSLTVPGIVYVIDPGLARISRYSARTKVQGLPVEAISRASADQRKGRCGRVSAGVCYRLYSEEDYETREEFTPPEIMRTNLASVVLQMAGLKLGRPERFPFVEAPDSRLIKDGYETLRELDAIDGDDELTDIGKALARLPIDPRIGRMLLAADEESCLNEMLIIAAGVSVQDPRDRPPEKADAADEAHEQFTHETSDFLGLLNIWRFWHDTLRKLSRSKRAKACRQNFLSERRLREWQDVLNQLRQLMTELGYRARARAANEAAVEESVHRALLTGLLTNIGKKGKKYEYEGARNQKFALHPSSALFESKPKWVMTAELVRTTRLYARTNAAIDPAWIEELGGHLLKKSYADPHWDKRAGRVNAYEKATLSGLEIYSRRPAHFGPIEPETSREIFIMAGLVDGEFRTRAPAIEHNRALTEEVRALEEKARRRNILAETDAIYRFYDDRLPGDVWSGQRFERWYRKVSRDEPSILRMTREDLIVGEADRVTPEAYPDEAAIGSADLRLRYRFEPGHEADGVTLETPIGLLGQIREADADRLVPGLLADKVEALMRSLPKRLRRYFDVVPVAREIADGLVSERETTDLRVAVARRLAARIGVEVRAEDFDVSQLPEHLAMRYLVLGEEGEKLAAGRDLPALRSEFAERIRAAFRLHAAEAFDREGLTEFDFDELPERVRIEAGAVPADGFPAIVDEGMKKQTVALRLMDIPEAAEQETRRGLMRLFSKRLKTEFKIDERSVPGFQMMALRYAPLGSADVFRDELMLLVADRVFLAEDGLVRTAAAFEARLDLGWSRLSPRTNEAVAVAGEVLGRMQRVKALLESDLPPAWKVAVADAADQLNHLCSPGMLTRTPWGALRSFPRYLRAIEVRFERLRSAGEQKDRAKVAEVRGWIARYRERAERHAERGVIDPALEELRWMIEELRVSLFAQELGTAGPVSKKRLDSVWERVLPA